MIELKIDKVFPDPEAKVRIIYDIDELAESIKEQGQIEPVLAYEKDGKYYVYVGLRRFFAIKQLFERYGKPDSIKVEIMPEPDPETKRKIIIAENADRQDLTIYDKLWLVWSNNPLLSVLKAKNLISQKFIREASPLRRNFNEDELKRFYEIEKALESKSFLTLEHIKMLADLDPQQREYAVFLLVSYRMPASEISNLNLFISYASADQEKLRKLNIKKPETINAPLMAEPQKPKPESTEEKKQTETKQEKIQEQENTAQPASTLHEEERIIEHPIHDFATFRVNNTAVIIYVEKEPEVKMLKVGDGEIVEIGGEKHRFHLV